MRYLAIRKHARTAYRIDQVPEVIVARHSGITVLGLAVITNTPGLEHKISHDEVLAEAQRASDRLVALILNILETV